MFSPLFRRLAVVRPVAPIQCIRPRRPRITISPSVFASSSPLSTQTKAQQEALQARHLAEAKRRALLREDFSLPLRLLKGLLLLLTVSGGTLALHTLAVHAFTEHASPTPAALDFWTRTHLRRAYMLQEYQHDPVAALKYVQRALEEENQFAESKQWAMWKREYLQLVMRLAHAYLLATRVEDAARVVAGVSEELHAKLVVEATGASGTAVAAGDEQIARLAKLLVQVDSKLSGLYVRLGQAGVAREVAWDAVELARGFVKADGDDTAAVVAGAWMAWADANKAEYLAKGGEDVRKDAVRGYEEVLVLTTAAQSRSAQPATPTAASAVTFIQEGMPQPVPLACMAAIASYHMGDLLATQRYRSTATAEVKPTPAPASSSSSSSSWWPFRKSSAASTPHLPALTSAPDTADILHWFQTALSLASTRATARPCQECQSATLSTVGQVFYREGDQVQAVHFYREGLKVARQAGDVESEKVCERGLQGMGVPLEEGGEQTSQG